MNRSVCLFGDRHVCPLSAYLYIYVVKRLTFKYFYHILFVFSDFIQRGLMLLCGNGEVKLYRFVNFVYTKRFFKESKKKRKHVQYATFGQEVSGYAYTKLFLFNVPINSFVRVCTLPLFYWTSTQYWDEM